MEESYKLSIKHRKILNLAMKDVVKAGVLKLLKFGIILVFSNST